MDQRIRQLTVNPRGFVFNRATGATFTTNETGQRILELLLQGETEETIAATLTAEFAVEEDEAGEDLATFLDDLEQYLEKAEA